MRTGISARGVMFETERHSVGFNNSFWSLPQDSRYFWSYSWRTGFCYSKFPNSRTFSWSRGLDSSAAWGTVERL